MDIGRQPVSHADILAGQGWGDSTSLWGVVQAWCNLLRLYRADVVVLDYAPTALIASRAQGVPTVAIGTGFELPPSIEPLPPFPGFPGATAQAAARAEVEVLSNANEVLQALGMPCENSLARVLRPDRCFLTTFSELDHYGARADANYVGPVNALDAGNTLEWPMDSERKIFAYLRADTPSLSAILESLDQCGRGVVCYAPGVSRKDQDRHKGPSFAFSDRPVLLSSLFKATDLCVSYAPAGFIATALMSGIPQLLSPSHVEAQLTAHRVELLGAGLILRGPQTGTTVARFIDTLLHTARFRERADAFAQQYAHSSPEAAADRITGEIESLAA
jgi:UDP:flavonoid glycosyltransferase YjiC (YdhE family)